MSEATGSDVIGTFRFAGRDCRYRVGWDSGEVFAPGDDYDGPTVVIEVANESDGGDILRALQSHRALVVAAKHLLACEHANDLVARLPTAFEKARAAVAKAAGVPA